MTTHFFKQKIKFFLLALVLVSLATVVEAFGPNATPPGSNVDGLIDSSTTYQKKGGGSLSPGVRFEVNDSTGTNDWFTASMMAIWEQMTITNDAFVESLDGLAYVCAEADGKLVTCVEPVSAISVDLTATPEQVYSPSSSTNLVWNTTGSPDACVGSVDWSGNKAPAGSSEVQSGLAVGTYTYTITCSKAGTSDVSDTVIVTVSNTISGSIRAECLDTRTWHPWPTPVDYHQGTQNLSFIFDRPLPANVTIQAIVCQDWPDIGISYPYADGCWSTNFIPNWPSQPGGIYTLSHYANIAFNLNLSQGATTYTTARPWITGSVGNSNYGQITCVERGGTRRHRGTVGRIKHLYLKVTSSTPYVLQFSGMSYNLGQNPQSINITQIP